MNGSSADEAGLPTAETSPATPYLALLDHAVRYWKAEEENARRYGNRINLQLTLVAIFLGLGLFRLLAGHDLANPWATVVALVLISGLLLFGLGLLFLLDVFPLADEHRAGRRQRRRRLKRIGRLKRSETRRRWAAWRREKWPCKVVRTLRQRSRAPASQRLRFPEKYLTSLAKLPKPPEGSAKQAQLESFALTYDAGLKLAELNAREARRINIAQQWILLGLTAFVVALGVYLLAPRRILDGAEANAVELETNLMEFVNGEVEAAPSDSEI